MAAIQPGGQRPAFLLYILMPPLENKPVDFAFEKLPKLRQRGQFIREEIALQGFVLLHIYRPLEDAVVDFAG